jgi:16S rRNA (guanine527-N7)-methyltransferase
MPDERSQALTLLKADLQLGERLSVYVDLLARWRRITNLVSDSTFDHVWLRHIADSGQLKAFAPGAIRWVDLGSGAGFPGMVIAIQLTGVPGARVDCIESDQRKCAFLREVARATGAPARIHAVRIESLDPDATGPVDAVTARALAPLPRLVELANVWLARGAVGLFPRGRSAGEQLEGLSLSPDLRVESLPSVLEPRARIVRIRRAEQAPS